MSFLAHHAIIVTSNGYSEADAALSEIHAFASSLRVNEDFGGAPLPVTPIVAGAMNGHNSFAVLPDGSKEGWTVSDEGDEAREAILRRLEATRYDDGSAPLSWVEVCFGGDMDGAEITSDRLTQRETAEVSS